MKSGFFVAGCLALLVISAGIASFNYVEKVKENRNAKNPNQERLLTVAALSYTKGCLDSAIRNCPKLYFTVLVSKCYDANTDQCKQDGKRWAEWLREKK